MPQPIRQATATPRTAPIPADAGSVELWNAASRNTAVSKPSRITAKNAIPTSAIIEPSASAVAALDAQLAGEAASVPAHPDDHERDHRDGQQADDGLEALLLPLRADRCSGPGERRATPMQIVTAAPTPTHIQRRRVTPALLAQERGDDADDEGGLDAFAKADDEGGQHDCSPLEFGHPH